MNIFLIALIIGIAILIFRLLNGFDRLKDFHNEIQGTLSAEKYNRYIKRKFQMERLRLNRKNDEL